ncbi:plasmid replication initiator TrfA [Acidithiobacillus albertensis]|uniref:plasmid replication initiator TrfA n=1 Tax=Acidithiobacillus albertensis TaxID=119978 RepID=UPI000A3EBE97|nr:plasmid replication initiator TrfA [Acidithiobacillus albertensis]
MKPSKTAENRETKSRRDPFEWVRQKAAEAVVQADQEAAETPRQMFLPGFDIGAFPNHLNRSSLIAPIARGRRKFHRQAAMVTRKDCVLEYTGEQLDEADGDLIMALIAFAQPFPLGAPVPLNRKELLRKIKPGSIGSTQYDWLYKSMKRLREGILFLEVRKPDGSTRYTVGKMESFNVLKELKYDGNSEAYSYTLDPRWVVMFGNREYSLIDWDKRLQIGRGLDMAKTLQRLVATSSDPVQRYALDWLKAKMEYVSPMRKFREALVGACEELERLEIISNHKIEDSTKGKMQLALWLQPSV